MSANTLISGAIKKRRQKKSSSIGTDVGSQLQLHAMLLPGTLLILLFSIVPLFGILIAFNDFRPIMGWRGIFTADFNNFRNFTQLVRSAQFWPMIRNTVGINILGSLISLPTTIIFALLLNEVLKKKFRSFVQTITIMPHFISWAIYGGLVVTMLSMDGGLINVILMALRILPEPIPFLGRGEYFWLIAVLSGLLKDLGWGAIIYLAAIAGVDPTLYEVAVIDGAKRHHKMLYVTIPCILPTLMIMIIFSIAGMLGNNFTQIYVLQNPLNLSHSQVIDTYVFQVGLQRFQFGIATAASLSKSVIALVLLTAANFASKKLTGSGLF